MKKILALIALLLCSAGIARAQGVVVNDDALANVGGVLKIIGGAQIDVCTYTATPTLPCTSHVAIYSDPGLSVPLANPFNADGNGNFTYFYSSSLTTVTETQTAVGITGRSVTRTAIASGGGGGGCSGGVNGNLIKATGLTTCTDANIVTANVAQKPVTGATICYASVYGNDANDGTDFSVAHSKQSIMGCYDQLATAGSAVGIIHVMDDGSGIRTGKSTDPSGCGIWILGPSDPNFSSPPACWRKQVFGGITVIGEGGFSSRTNLACDSTHGFQSDNNHPCIWISGTNANMKFENLDFAMAKPNIGIRIACTSNFGGVLPSAQCATAGGNASGIRFENVLGNIPTVAGVGPSVFIGSNSFWIFFLNSGFGGNPAEQATISALSRASNVLTVTHSALTVTMGERVGIVVAPDATYNGSFSVASVIDGTHFTVNQIGPNGSSSGGYVITDKQIPIVIDAGTGSGSGLVYIQGQPGGNFFSQGAVRLWPGTNGGGVYADHFTVEGDFTHQVAPAVWVADGAPPINVRVDSIEMADTLNTVPAYDYDCGSNGGACQSQHQTDYSAVTRSDGSIGPSSGVASLPSKTYFNRSPLQDGFNGASGGQLYGRTDAARRLFGPTGMPGGSTGVELANQSSGSWTILSGALTTGLTAPDGTTGAVELTGAAGEINIPVTTGPSLAAGNIYVFGAWVKSPTSGAYAGGPPFTFETNANGFGANNVCRQSGIARVNPNVPTSGGGGWQFVSGLCYLTVVDATIGAVLDVHSDAGDPIEIYQPTVFGFAAGSIPEPEAYEIAENLGTVPGNCPASYACTPLGMQVAGPLQAASVTVPGTTGAIGLGEGSCSVSASLFDEICADAGSHSMLLSNNTGVLVSISQAQAEYCGATSGATQACAKTKISLPFIVQGDVALNTATSQSITALPFATGTYSCSGSDLTTAAGVVSFSSYLAASVTIAETGGANTDHLRFTCVGN